MTEKAATERPRLFLLNLRAQRSPLITAASASLTGMIDRRLPGRLADATKGNSWAMIQELRTLL